MGLETISRGLFDFPLRDYWVWSKCIVIYDQGALCVDYSNVFNSGLRGGNVPTNFDLFSATIWGHVMMRKNFPTAYLDCTRKFLSKMQYSRLPEHLQHVRGLFYGPTSESISGQMAVVAGLAGVDELKLYLRKCRSKNKTENKHWLQASLKLWNEIGIQGQMVIHHFQNVVDLYPEKRIAVYSFETHQPIPEGCFTGVEYNMENASKNTLLFSMTY